MFKEPQFQDNMLELNRGSSTKLASLRIFLPFLKPHKGRIALALLVIALAAGSMLAFGKGLQWAVDRGFQQGHHHELAAIFGFFFFLVTLLSIASYGRVYMISAISERIVADIRAALFQRLIASQASFLEVTSTGEIISRLTNDTTILQLLVGSAIPIFLRNIFIVIGALIMMLMTSSSLTSLILLLTPLVLGPIIFLGKRVKNLSSQAQVSMADMGGRLDEIFNNSYVVQAFNQEPYAFMRFKEAVERNFEAAIARLKAKASLTAFVMMWIFSAIIGVLWLGAERVFAGLITAGDLSAFLFYAIATAGATGSLTEIYGDLTRAAGAAERLIDFMNLPLEDTKASFQSLTFNQTLTLDHVSFSYPSRPQQCALSNISLTIQKGEKIALVGPSGAGKSTIFHLLLHFHASYQGILSLDGVNLAQVDKHAIRDLFGVVPQETILFNTTIRDNILFAKPDATEAELREAARTACALSFIEQLPQGFDTFIGERGVRLSGGQKQRIAIARAVLKNPSILLLDEATSALDAESEQAVQQALDNATYGRTTLMIAHNLASIQNVDRIVVLDHGKLVDCGTHEELLNRCKLYQRFIKLQKRDL